MTLAELASFVTSKVNQSEPEDVLACKNFLKRRFEMVWQAQLWKDSLFEFTQTLGAIADYEVTDTWLPTKQILLLPTVFTHVVAVRTADRKLNVESSEVLYRSDVDAFADTGQPTKYRQLSPCVWEWDEAVDSLSINGPSEADSETPIVLDETLGTVTTRYSDQMQNIPTTTAPERVEVFTKATSDDTISLYVNYPLVEIIQLAATDTAALKRQRIQLLGTVVAPITIRVLGKVKMPTFTADADEPGLTGVENCLIAFAQADMLERERQYSKAKALQDQGAALLELLTKEQTKQQAYHKRLVPEDGYQNEYGMDRWGVWGSDWIDGSKGSPTPTDSTPQRVSGTLQLANGVSDGSIPIGLSFIPVSVNLTMIVPAGGLAISVNAVSGTLSSSGCNFVLTGTTDSDQYAISWEFIGPS